MKPKISRDLMMKVYRMPEYKMGAHLVTLTLRDGRKVKNVIIAPCDEVWGIGIQEKKDEADLGFLIVDIIDAEHQPWSLPEQEDEWWKT